jgi:chaperonin GroEL (HSP60 family)
MTGPLGIINLEPSPVEETHLINIQGGVIPKGYSDINYTSKSSSQIMKMENPLILVSDLLINDPKDLTEAMTFARISKRPLLIFTSSLDEKCTKQIMLNLHKNIVQCVCVEMQATGDFHLETLEDLAVLFNAQIIKFHNKELLRDSSQIHKVFGKCKEIKLDILDSEFLTSEYKSEEHLKRIDNQIQNLLSTFIEAF